MPDCEIVTGLVAQWLEHQTCHLKVSGSIPLQTCADPYFSGVCIGSKSVNMYLYSQLG